MYAVETEPNVRALLCRIDDIRTLSQPAMGPGRVILYVSHHSSDIELREEPLVKELLTAEPKSEFYALDVRGIGDSRRNSASASD